MLERKMKELICQVPGWDTDNILLQKTGDRNFTVMHLDSLKVYNLSVSIFGYVHTTEVTFNL